MNIEVVITIEVEVVVIIEVDIIDLIRLSSKRKWV